MKEYAPVIDVTEEFLTMPSYELNDHIRSLGAGVLVGVSFPILEEAEDTINRTLLRKTKAFAERSPHRLAVVIATKEQIAIEPNVFSSGVSRILPE